MDHYSTTFFQHDEKKNPVVKIKKLIKEDQWTNTIEVQVAGQSSSAPVTIHLLTESDLYKFINSAIWELRRYRKEQGYDR